MTWKQLLEAVAERSGLPESEVRVVLSAGLELAAEALVRGESVRLPGLGTLDAPLRSLRRIRTIHDGRLVAIDPFHAARFRPAASLKRALRNRTPRWLQREDHHQAWRLGEALVDDLALYHPQRSPTGLSSNSPLLLVEEACRQAFGQPWIRARRTWEEQTPAEVQRVRDYLALAARRRWASR